MADSAGPVAAYGWVLVAGVLAAVLHKAGLLRAAAGWLAACARRLPRRLLRRVPRLASPGVLSSPRCVAATVRRGDGAAVRLSAAQPPAQRRAGGVRLPRALEQPAARRPADGPVGWVEEVDAMVADSAAAWAEGLSELQEPPPPPPGRGLATVPAAARGDADRGPPPTRRREPAAWIAPSVEASVTLPELTRRWSLLAGSDRATQNHPVPKSKSTVAARHPQLFPRHWDSALAPHRTASNDWFTVHATQKPRHAVAERRRAAGGNESTSVGTVVGTAVGTAVGDGEVTAVAGVGDSRYSAALFTEEEEERREAELHSGVGRVGPEGDSG